MKSLYIDFISHRLGVAGWQVEHCIDLMEEGATTLSREEYGSLAQRQAKFIRNLEMALVRIKNKTYGICKTTGKLIPKERLMRVPHTTECIEAKESRK